MKLHVYFDYGSIYSYLAWARWAYGHVHFPEGLEVLWKPVSSGHIIHQEGHGTNAEYTNWNSYTKLDAQRVADGLGVRLDPTQIRPHKCLNAMRLHLLADQKGEETEHRFMRAVFETRFVDGEDVEDDIILAPICEAVGIEDGPSVCNQQSLKNLLIANTEEAYERGAPGVPYFVLENDEGQYEPFWGQDRMLQVATRARQLLRDSAA